MNLYVSVILPIRNEEEYIEQCLKALIEQTYNPSFYEILVVDGMSSDATRKIVKHLIEITEKPKMRLFDNPVRFVPHALNLGLKNARGELIFRVDGHAIVANDYIEQCVATLNNTSADCVGGPIETVNDTLIGRAIAFAMSSPMGVGNSYFRTSHKARYVDTLAFPAYRREVFEKIGSFDEELIRNQDDEFNYRLRKFGGRIFLSPKINSRYFPGANFKKLWKQFFGYGYYRIRVLQKHSRMTKVRHIVPAGFVWSLMFSAILGFLFDWGWVMFGLIVTVYLAASVVASLRIGIKQGLHYVPLLMFSFVVIHFGNGFGLTAGLVKFSPRWFGKENSHPAYQIGFQK